ncbi:MerR family transcriptional regulator [Embleya sp. NPDC059237]|uniref:MerR family transcriptional regulator n=1 Tax=Embleya sp. NPDC059237 TaxID=3346784 RepID=UPI0036A5F553
MRIGEIAALAGVSTRTVRHYHNLGIVPEPPRLPNGYREYRLRDALLLARARRLADLGLPLDEVRAVLDRDRERDLRDVLAELDTDLARQQEAIAARRARLAVLLADPDLDPDSTVSPALADVLREFPVHESHFARLDREFLALIDTTATPEQREAFADLLRPLAEPAMVARGAALTARLDALADADPDDPRVERLARDFADFLPDGLTDAMRATEAAAPESAPASTPTPTPTRRDAEWLGAIATELSAAQTEVFRRLVALLRREP